MEPFIAALAGSVGLLVGIGVGWVSWIPRIQQLEGARQREEELNAQLRQANQDLEQFAYVASHDLKAPLRRVGAYVDLLLEDTMFPEGSQGPRYSQFIQDGVRDMNRLITDLLRFSRAGRKMTIEPFPLRDAFARARQALAEDVLQSGATIRVHNLPDVHGDAHMLTQVFQNLLSNALKFCGDAPPNIEVFADEGQEFWCVCVRDLGIGIDQKYLSQVFEVFTRLYSSEQYEGTGIGLALVRRVIHAHGGRVWIDSSGPGDGTTVCFTLPKPHADE